MYAGKFDVAADMNSDGEVNGLDVDPFVAAVVGSGAQSIPEPSTLLLGIVALGVVGGLRKWGAITKRQRSAILPAIRQHVVQQTEGAPPRPHQTPPV